MSLRLDVTVVLFLVGLGVLASELDIFLVEEGMEAMSTSRLVLLLINELVPMMISELVQSRKGFNSQLSSSSLI